jgi:hypothetical protein
MINKRTPCCGTDAPRAATIRRRRERPGFARHAFSPMRSMLVRLGAIGMLALATGTAHAAPPAVAGNAIRVEAYGRDDDIVRLIDSATRVTIAADRLPGRPVRESLVASDDSVAAVRYGADGGDCLAVYAIRWSVDPASGTRAAQVTRVLDYRPRDGHLGVSLQVVPNGVVVQVRSGRHPPFWDKVFLHERASGTWYEWERQLAPLDPTNGVPRTVGETGGDPPYAARLRPLDPRVDGR